MFIFVDMLMRFSIFSAMVPLSLWMTSCGEISHGNIPEKTVNFTVRPYSMDNVLLATGGYKYFPYGYMGVVVYHIGDMDEEYVAFEQACPLDWENGCFVEYDKEQDVLTGKTCKGRFSSFTGYGRDKKNSGYALRKYHISYFGTNGEFQVSN